jgi:hypothetical protein
VRFHSGRPGSGPLLPRHLQPPWRRLPWLAWIAATGALPWNLGPGQLLVAPVAILMLPLLAAARLTGQLAAERRALVLILHRRPAALLLLIVTVVLFAAGTAGTVLLTLTWPVTTYPLVALAGYTVGVLVVAMAAHSHRSWRAARRARPQPAVEIRMPRAPGTIELCCAVAWPRRRRHGGALWKDLAAIAGDLDRPGVARAATTELAAAYAAYTDPPGTVAGRVVIWATPALAQRCHTDPPGTSTLITRRGWSTRRAIAKAVSAWRPRQHGMTSRVGERGGT